MTKQKRYYKVEEKVFVKEDKAFGVIKSLNVNPKEGVYKALVEVTKEIDGGGQHITTKELDLWEIDKDKRKGSATTTPSRKSPKKETLKVPVKYFDDSLPEIEEIEVGNWIDLYARQRFELGFLQNELIPLNVAMQLPKGYEAHLLPRSSTYKKWGIISANGTGIIDTTYCGDGDEWKFSAISLRPTVIEKGDKIAQFRIVKEMPKTKFPKVDKLGNANRGGFGTTGTSVTNA
jgi:dUTP pyrophosphatase